MNMLTNLSTRLLRVGLCLSLTLLSVIGAQAQITWTGAVDNIYTRPGNWNLGRVPNSTDAVTIPQNGTIVPLVPAPTTGPTTVTVTVQPVLDANLGIGTAGNLTINANASLTLNLQSELDLFGNLTNNGLFVGQGLLSMRSAVNPTMHTISGASAANAINIRDLELLTGAPTTLSLPMTLVRLLTLNDNLTVNTTSPATGALTLLSTANPPVTAFVINNGTSVVTGPVTVQRAIDPAVNAGVGYRHYSSPVSNTTVNDLTTSGFSPTLTTSYNTSSFAPGTRPFPTVFGYDQARLITDNGYSPANGFSTFDRGWFVPASTATPMTPGLGYTVNITSNQLVDFVGTLNNAPTGTAVAVPFARNATGTPAADNAGWVFLGNPFPAPIDYSLVAAADRAGLDNAMYVYSSTSQYGGFYRAYPFFSGTTPSGNPVIPIAQGFFVHVTSAGTTGTFNFRNSQRLVTSDATTFQRTAADLRPQLELALHSSDKVVQDMLNVYFEAKATGGTDPQYDAVKPQNNNGMMLNTTSADGEALAIDSRPMPTDGLTMPLRLTVATNGSYTLEATKLENLSGGMHAYLHDLKLGSYVDLAAQPEYTFSINAANTAPRFELVFSARSIDTAAPAALTQQVSLYPSPAKDMAYLELPASLGNEAIVATLVDALGRTVRTTNLAAEGESAHQLSLSGLRSGIYALRLHTSAGIVAKRLVIE